MEPTKKKPGRPKKVVEPKRNAMGRIIEETPVAEAGPLYKLTLTMGGKVYESEGTSVIEVLEKLPHPEKIFVKGFVSLTHGEAHTERLFMPFELKRFLYPVARRYVAKGLTHTLK